MPIAGGILVAGSASRCLSSAAGMLRFLARLSGRRRHVRRSCGPGGGSSCCGTVKEAGETRAIAGSACVTSESGSIGNRAGTTAASTTTTTTTTSTNTMTTGTATTRSATTTSTTTTTMTRIDEKYRFEARKNEQTIDRIQDSRWTPLEVSIERLSCDRLRQSNVREDENSFESCCCCCFDESCSHHFYSSRNADESLRRIQDNEYLERSFELSRRLDVESPPEASQLRNHYDRPHREDASRPKRNFESNGQRLTRVEDKIQDNYERVTRRLHHRLHAHRNNKHSAPVTSSSSLIVEPASFDDTATTTITTTTTATTTTTTILRSGRTRTRLCSGGSDECLVDDNNSSSNDHHPSKYRRSPIFSNDPRIFHNEIQQRELGGDGGNQRNGHHPDNSSFSNTSYTRRRTFPPYLATLLIISYTLFGIADACSSRSTPKPRPPTPTPRPNITFHMYTCPPDYAEWYCLNGATCFTVKIQEALLYNCLCANGFIGQRCEFKDLDGSYLPSRQRVMLETASIAGGATIAVFLVVIICIAAYIHCKRKQKELRTSTCVDTVDGPGRDPELRPFSNRSRSLMIFMAKNPNGSTMCPSIEQTRMPGWSDYSQTETARMASVNEEKRGSSQ